MRTLALLVASLALALALAATAAAKGIERAEVCDRHGCVDLAPAQAFLIGGPWAAEPPAGETYYLRLTWMGEGGSTVSDYRAGRALAGDGRWYRLPRRLRPAIDVAAVSIVPTTAVRGVLDAAAT